MTVAQFNAARYPLLHQPTGAVTEDDSPWVAHARRELSLVGNDPEFNASIVSAIRAFAAFGHSGASAEVGIELLTKLLKWENLTELTKDPAEWIDRSEMSSYPLWQSKRNPAAFSKDGGKTYYLLSDNYQEHISADPPDPAV